MVFAATVSRLPSRQRNQLGELLDRWCRDGRAGQPSPKETQLSYKL